MEKAKGADKAKKQAQKAQKRKQKQKAIQATSSQKQQAASKAQQVTAILLILSSIRSPYEKLDILLADPPRKSQNQELKDNMYYLIISTLCTIKVKDLDEILKLKDEKLEVLLQYIYKGWERLGLKQKKSTDIIANTSLLLAHKKIVEKLGVYCILKVANYQEHTV